jgi:hypothetical protein
MTVELPDLLNRFMEVHGRWYRGLVDDTIAFMWTPGGAVTNEREVEARGARVSKTTKGAAASVMVVPTENQRWASPRTQTYVQITLSDTDCWVRSGGGRVARVAIAVGTRGWGVLIT